MTTPAIRDVQVLPIAPQTTILRSRTWERLKFEVEYGLKKGTTANSYWLQGQKSALIDPPGASFTAGFLDCLQSRFDLKNLDYLILGHVNPNRATTLKEILAIAPQVTVVCSNPAAQSLRKIWEDTAIAPKFLIIKGEESLDLGLERILDLIPTPNPRFPDHLCTYDRQHQILFSDKLFCAHVCSDQVFDEGWEVYAEDRRYYFDCVMAAAPTQIANTLDKLAPYGAQCYAPNHGPLVRYGFHALNQNYRQWLQQQQQKALSVALIYASAYGNTATLAQAIARGITKAGVRVDSLNAEVATTEEIKTAINQSAGFLMGSPTLGGHAPTQIQTALGIVLAHAQKKQLAGAFGSFGWSGEAIDLLETKFKDAGFRLGIDTIRVKFKPDEHTLQTCEEAGTDFAQQLKKTAKARKAKPTRGSESDRTTQALGRIVGSLSIVTTQRDGVRGGMLASWISQATFDPPGLTVAVAKDRAIESFLYRDQDFILNILEEGEHGPLMKHFLKPFAPGADRFEGVDWESGENHCPILKDALAYLECRVANRMECGDHWLIYAIVNTGQVFREGVTAVHHRKSGDHY